MSTSHHGRSIATGIMNAGLMALCLQLSGACQAAAARQHAQPGESRAQPAKKSRSAKVKQQQNHSGESTAERDRRLYRECQGLPNAGACLGYTRR